MDDARKARRRAVAEEIFALMGRRRISQTQLADAIGSSQSSLSRRLNCHQAFDLDEVCDIAEYFDVPLTKLLPELAYPGSEATPGLLSSYASV